MDELKQRVENSAIFYSNNILKVDYKLAEFSFRTLKPFFKGSLALELGPASGYMTQSLVSCFSELHIVEGAKALLDQIPNYDNVRKHHSLFEDFETNLRFKTIIMSHVLEHISDPVPLLKKILNWLDNDGVFLVSVPNAKSIHRLVAVEMGLLSSVYEMNNRDKELGHFRIYDEDLLINHIEAAGFRIINNGTYFLKPVANNQIETSWTGEMIEGFFKAGKYFPHNCAELFVVASW